MKEGSVVIYLGTTDEQVTWGGHDDPRGVLVERAVYTVDSIGDWGTDICLVGIQGRFNSVVFEEIEDTESPIDKTVNIQAAQKKQFAKKPKVQR